MLTIPHEIWMPCEFTRRVFRAAGIPNVHCWINLRIGFGRYGDINRSFPSHRRRLSEIILEFYGAHQPLVFVSILNPHEPGKNLTALIGGFLEFHDEHPGSLLLLKLVVDNTTDRLDDV